MPKNCWNRQRLVVGAISISCITGSVGGLEAIAPQPAHAYVARVDVVLEIQPGERYETFLSRAETVARAAIQRSFDRDILTSEVYAIIVGQRQGASVQVLSAQMSRSQWRSRPDPRRWATYYPSARILLGFGAPARNASPPAPAAIAPQPSSIEVPSIPAAPANSAPAPDASVSPSSAPSPDPFSPPPNLLNPALPGSQPGTTPLPPVQPGR
ncbi:MAG: hypothetical protein IGS48_14685 [Oscillatoriales cyanobacterium C42_A2020_001]|nr:hypothetical protein [Leptolyngbyaceae cyanobacterium C42_A2020_001]